MRKILFTIIISLIAVNVYAADIKIGYVDLNKALNESEEGKQAVKTLEEMVKSKQKSINQKGEDIKKIDEEIAKQASVLNPDAIKEKREKRETLMRDYQRMIKDSQDEVQKKQTEFRNIIIKKLRKILEKIGKEEKYTVIFERAEGGILYIPKEIDLTEKLIKQFNESQKEPAKAK